MKKIAVITRTTPRHVAKDITRCLWNAGHAPCFIHAAELEAPNSGAKADALAADSMLMLDFNPGDDVCMEILKEGSDALFCYTKQYEASPKADVYRFHGERNSTILWESHQAGEYEGASILQTRLPSFPHGSVEIAPISYDHTLKPAIGMVYFPLDHKTVRSQQKEFLATKRHSRLMALPPALDMEESAARLKHITCWYVPVSESLFSSWSHDLDMALLAGVPVVGPGMPGELKGVCQDVQTLGELDALLGQGKQPVMQTIDPSSINTAFLDSLNAAMAAMENAS